MYIMNLLIIRGWVVGTGFSVALLSCSGGAHGNRIGIYPWPACWPAPCEELKNMTVLPWLLPAAPKLLPAAPWLLASLLASLLA